ncbi:MAG TPA: hypothetical protein VMF88_10500 [Bacteroidota bacterium]|nr:hypothetical protein [Bacteroidota bacterium]
MGERSRVENTSDLILSGWATRDFTLEEFDAYLGKFRPAIVEISKDFVDKTVSSKGLYGVIAEFKKSNPGTIIAFAGTTDFCLCSSLDFPRYIKYLSVQSAQAHFFDSSIFRIMIGGNTDFLRETVLDRLDTFEKLIAPIGVGVEIHKGWESSLEHIKLIVDKTNFNFIIDFQNSLDSHLDFNSLHEVIPQDRISYFHTRNLGEQYVEHQSSLEEERMWLGWCRKPLLWEPKKINKNDIVKYSYGH